VERDWSGETAAFGHCLGCKIGAVEVVGKALEFDVAELDSVSAAVFLAAASSSTPEPRQPEMSCCLTVHVALR